MKREILKIDEDKCNGCGLCIPNCHEGALQIIDGKARLISDLMCDGLGACIGHCPEGAMEIEVREAEPVTAAAAKGHQASGGCGGGAGHDHQKAGASSFPMGGGCPGSMSRSFAPPASSAGGNNTAGFGTAQNSAAQNGTAQNSAAAAGGSIQSHLAQWPVQMHLINPRASHFAGSDLLLAADCVAYAAGNFHNEYLKGKTLAIACPKLDSNREVYLDKLVSLVRDAKINTLTVMKMEVPCCSGIEQMAVAAVKKAGRKVPVKSITLGIRGDVIDDRWL